ncbi:MAG: hypothetical protein AB7Q97_22560 [Gammaproteobacteria bacterium]
MRLGELSENQRRLFAAVIFLIVAGSWTYFALSDLGDVVSKQYPGQLKFMVAGRDSYGSAAPATESRSYILVPRILSSPTVVTVRREGDKEPEVHEDPISWGLVAVCIAFLLFGVFAKRWKRDA